MKREQYLAYQREYAAEVWAIDRPGHELCDRPACCAQGRRNYNRKWMRRRRANAKNATGAASEGKA